MLSFTDAVLPIEQLSTCPEGRLQEAHCQEKEASVILSACRWCQHDKNPTCPYLSALWQPLTKRALSTSPARLKSHLWHTQKGEFFSEK
jgi:hypothetical protein